MKTKLKDYIDTIFADAPQSYRAYELKEEMYTDLCEKYDDLIAEGKTPAAAYHAVISGVGDISELIEELRRETGADTSKESESYYYEEAPSHARRAYTVEEQETIRKYRNRGAVMTALSVAMYTTCWLPLVILGALWDGVGGIVGLCVMFLMIATATALNIIHGMTKPECLRRGKDAKDDDDDDDDDEEKAEENRQKTGRRAVFKAVSSALWLLVVAIYLGVSFWTGAWHITWIIFLIAAAVENIIKACMDLRS
ncbi:MAG: hypothetical protein E7661_00895 [Ruminococcaceae bacterium]|nr:hypothetical protein [Oscillospiraceae bacterium]